MTDLSAAEDGNLPEHVKGVSRETLERLTIYCRLLVQWQKRINLIAPSTVDHIWQRHVADSLQISAMIPDVDHLVDMGSGGGFPGLVCAMVMAERGAGQIDLIESNGKKCAFLNAVIRETGLRNTDSVVSVHNDRIEKVLPKLQNPDVITARALASLNDLLGLTQSNLQTGTRGLFAKGRDHQQELALARKHWSFDCKIHDSNLEAGSVVLEISELKPL